VIIGNFVPDNELTKEYLSQSSSQNIYRAFYYIDDVSLVPDHCSPLSWNDQTQTVSNIPYDDPCDDWLNDVTINSAQQLYDEYINNLKDDFKFQFTEYCIKNAVENLSVSYQDHEHHYTLYYYDQAGNLIRTVPPAGVNTITGSNLQNVK